MSKTNGNDVVVPEVKDAFMERLKPKRKWAVDFRVTPDIENMVASRNLLIDEYQSQIRKVKRRSQEDKCDECGGSILRPKQDAMLQSWYKLIEETRQYIEKYIHQLNVNNLIDTITVEVAQAAWDVFLPAIPADSEKEKAMDKFQDAVKLRIDELARKITTG